MPTVKETTMTDAEQAPSTWWGRFKFEIEHNKIWQIGPLKLIVRRLESEWQVAFERLDESDAGSSKPSGANTIWYVADTDQLPETLKDNSRYVLQDNTGQLNIVPILADRPIISRPITPFNLTAGEEVTLYVSSLLWLQLSVGSAPIKALKEIPIQRLSDTWFGSSTLEGELCYASSTHCRVNLEDIPNRAHRALTPVLIRNQADTTLLVERLNLPAPLLHLYCANNAQLWTSKVTLIREKDGDIASLKIDDTPPTEAKGAVQISEPRIKVSNGSIFRAFNAVFR